MYFTHDIPCIVMYVFNGVLFDALKDVCQQLFQIFCIVAMLIDRKCDN